MSSPHSPMPQRFRVSAVKSLAIRTDSAPAPGVRVATFGYPGRRCAPGLQATAQTPLTSAAIPAADASQPQLAEGPGQSATIAGAAVTAASDTALPQITYANVCKLHSALPVFVMQAPDARASAR